MLNSFTNFLHALALSVYAWLAYEAVESGKDFFTWLIFWSFFLTFALKCLGIIVHLPFVEKVKPRHDLFWTLIALALPALNIVTLLAMNLPAFVITAGTAVALLFSFLFLRTLYNGPGYFMHLALSTVLIYLLAAIFTRDSLRIAWICIVLSSLAWILLEKVPFLLRYKLHNDIYHLALIASTYYLYTTVAKGLWENNRSPFLAGI